MKTSFREPVAWEAMGLVDYLTIVKTPMDLGTVKSKLDSREYKKFDGMFLTPPLKLPLEVQ
jgi:hypothetical protein